MDHFTECYLPERTIQTGIGDVPVKAPRVRDRIGRVRFSSAALLPYLRRTKTIDNSEPYAAPVRSVQAFADRGEPLTLSELSRLLSIPVSTCFNLMRTLQARGYLYEVGGRKMFYPTARWLVTSLAIASRDPVREQLQPYLESLRDETGETAILGKRMGEQVMYLAVVEGMHTIRYTANVGDLKPLHSNSAGKALLGAMTAAGAVFANHGFRSRARLRRHQLGGGRRVETRVLRMNNRGSRGPARYAGTAQSEIPRLRERLSRRSRRRASVRHACGSRQRERCARRSRLLALMRAFVTEHTAFTDEVRCQHDHAC